jgi:hypothetical protein
MLVPETTMDQYDAAVLTQNDVRLSRQLRRMQPEAQAQRM